ncbi:Cytochrome P450 2D19 [Rhizoctonia solani AG-1 IB]|uniref:Cytochrome P450 2D19 n=1 Tax=Thanatephorus cucumeris (strain AG1-IB / isolate 7/3/14) TaxID=1108050 RepID=M5C1P2_THACB|nr:Cytochrome P450 2D19 [Rhizoctonia solani AG-1 IB]
MVFEQVRNGGAETPSYLSQLLESKGGANITDIDMELTKWTAASLFTGGSTTTVGMVWSFVLMLSLHPEAAKLAQAEIDAVVGRERVPDLKDRESMPYMEAVLQEVMRLCPVVPLGTYKEASPTAEYSWLSQVSLIPLLRISNSEVIGFQRMQQLILTSGLCFAIQSTLRLRIPSTHPVS